MLFPSLIAKNLIQRPLRYLLTGLAIAFGVAAVTAVFIFTDGLRATFNELAGNIESGFDVSVQSDSPFGNGLEAAVVPLEALDVVSGVEGVRAVQPRIVEFGVVAIDGDGTPALANGPNIGLNWESRTPNPRLFLLDGEIPTQADQFALDTLAFEGANFVVGQTYTVLTPQGSQPFELAGVFSYADPEQSATVGAVIIAFEESVALDILNGGAGYDDLTVISDGDPDVLVDRLGPVLAELDDSLIAVSQAELIEEAQDSFGEILGIFQTVLLVFAAIILLVSAFLIFNVFTITLGQRIKELGLLRSIGAQGSQVTSMMLGEALLLGIVATIVGVPAGWLLARLLRFGLSQLGFPGDTGLPIRPWTIVWAILVGVVVTLLAAVWPSIKARRVTPMAALRDDMSALADDEQANPARGMAALIAGLVAIVVAFLFDGWLPRLALPILGGILIYLGVRWLLKGSETMAQIVLLVTGIVLLTIVRFGDFGLGETFGLLGAGAILTILGASLVSGIFASPAARAIGFPIPTALVVGLIGLVFAVGALASIGGAVYLVASEGNLLGLLLPIGGIFLGLAAYALLRTAKGAFGLTGRLARDNAARNPQRTATTATALMIGISLVTAVTVIGDSIKSSVTNALESSITSDWLITGPSSGPQGLPFSTEVADRVGALDEIDEVLAYRFSFTGFASLQGADAAEVQAAIPRLFGALGSQDDDPAAVDRIRDELGATSLNIDDVLAVDQSIVERHVDPDFAEGPVPADAGRGIWLEDSIAEDRGLAMGDTIVAVFLDGAVEELTVTAIYTDGFIFGSRVIDMELWERHLPSDTHQFLNATTADGVDPEAARVAMEGALSGDYPTLSVQDKAEFGADAEAQINQTLATVNVLLLLSAGIAILGIAIALSLSVFERTREIGLLRAVGTIRSQTRWMVRWEGVIVAAFGGIVGVILGVGLGILATQKMPEVLVTTTSVPVPSLISYVVIAAIVGLGAGAFPAWIAGRMDVLDAIANE